MPLTAAEFQNNVVVDVIVKHIYKIRIPLFVNYVIQAMAMSIDVCVNIA